MDYSIVAYVIVPTILIAIFVEEWGNVKYSPVDIMVACMLAILSPIMLPVLAWYAFKN